MRNINILFIALLAINLLFACKKKDKTPAPTVVGFWKGMYGNGTATPATSYAFLFRSNGTVRVYANLTDTATASKAEGTYNTSSTTVQTTYKYLPGLVQTFSTTATANEALTTMTGTWGSGSSTSGGGTFNLVKQ